jgi:hypothetical protein
MALWIGGQSLTFLCGRQPIKFADCSSTPMPPEREATPPKDDSEHLGWAHGMSMRAVG